MAHEDEMEHHFPPGFGPGSNLDDLRDAETAVEPCRCVYPDKCFCPPEARFDEGEADLDD